MCCNICIDLENGKLTREEADRHFREMVYISDEYSEETEHYLDAGIENEKKLIEESKKKDE